MTDYMEKLKQLAKHSIQLSIGGEETYRAGATRFGGRPDVPSDFVWPTFKGVPHPCSYKRGKYIQYSRPFITFV